MRAWACARTLLVRSTRRDARRIGATWASERPPSESRAAGVGAGALLGECGARLHTNRNTAVATCVLRCSIGA
jgi:hypothetical protein